MTTNQKKCSASVDDHGPACEALQRALEACGGNQSELARRCNVKQPHVWKWIKAGRVPTERVHAVAKASEGKVLPHELRPDLPDLFPAPATPAVAA